MKSFTEFNKVNENVNDRKRVLLVSGEDYSALMFEQEHSGVNVSDVMDNPDNYKPTENSEGSWELKIFEFGEIDLEFVNFVRHEIQDYDHSKDKNFWIEGEILK